ncbi:MAG: M48 family metallopeptidase [Acidobacteria bacterium]|nr:M48 family metallopeptidase [Acidobacteriota bacterium]
MTDTDFTTIITKNKRASLVLLAGFFALLAALGAGAGLFLGGSPEAAIAGVLIAIGLTIFSYYASSRMTLSMTGAKPADPSEYAQVHNLVEGMAIAAGIPKPTVYVVQDPAPNAFATGRDPDHAAVAVTTGLIETMNRVELEGVIAHEIGHVRNYDIRIMTVAVATAGSIAIFTDVFFRLMFFSGMSNSRRNRGGNGGNPLALVAVLIVAVLAPLAAALMKAAISRRRETIADATAVELTRYPTGLRQALEKLHADTRVVRRTSHATSHLWIETPDDHQPGNKGRAFNDMFDTHPPITERIDLLRAMEGIGPYQQPGPNSDASTAD